jgi:hypothetical protein
MSYAEVVEKKSTRRQGNWQDEMRILSTEENVDWKNTRFSAWIKRN